MYTVDVESLGATAIVVYLLPPALDKFSDTFRAWLSAAPGRRLVTIDYKFGPDYVQGWTPSETSQVTVPNRQEPVVLRRFE